MKKLILVGLAALTFPAPAADAATIEAIAPSHRSGCHRWHSCASDHATHRWRGLLCVAPYSDRYDASFRRKVVYEGQTFRTLDSLRGQGWTLGRLGLFRGSLRLHGQRGDVELELTYQATPRALSADSVYRSIQQRRGISPGGLRPDLVIRTTSRGTQRWLLIEVRGGERSLADSARAAAHDLLAYRTAFACQLEAQAGVYGLGIARGAGLEPTFTAGVSLCTPDALVTMNIYTHVGNAEKNEAIERLDALLG